jgi:Polyketide cyclase / dehydrase and lipid transport
MPDFSRQTRKITINQPADVLYDMITDVARIGEWSPVCKSAEWDEGAGAEVGAKFTGHNDDGARQWDMRCRVFVADPGKEFAWATVGMAGNPDAENDAGLTRWGYTFTPVDGGTEVEESWELTPPAIEMFNQIPEEQQDMLVKTVWEGTITGMETTLANLKSVAESS